ncbi:MAG: hypothetical protein GYA46_11555 [candidate division Zixibacteria bacterium]|nr:hypothetical protein [candidate division Zixibacteria bacterium]
MCKKILFAVMLAAGVIATLSMTAVAQDDDVSLGKEGATAVFTSPNNIMYQARLTTAAGAPITDTATVTFGIYAAYSGGTPLWQGAWQLNPDDNGIFSQEIGPIPDTVFTGATRYMQISVRGEAMTPRQTIASAPYSISTQTRGIQSTYGFQFVTFRSTSPSAPIAFGYIGPTGSVVSGTGNFTASWNSSAQRYEITITGHSYYYNTFTTVVTACGVPELFQTSSFGGMLLVYVYGL